MLKVAAPALLLSLAACAADSAPTRTAAQATSPELQGRVVGKPVSCISSRDIQDTDAVTDRVVLFHMRGNRVYRNDLPYSCPRLSRPGTAFAHRSTTNQLCSIDTIQVFDPISGFAFGGCQLGEFVPYELRKAPNG